MQHISRKQEHVQSITRPDPTNILHQDTRSAGRYSCKLRHTLTLEANARGHASPATTPGCRQPSSPAQSAPVLVRLGRVLEGCAWVAQDSVLCGAAVQGLHGTATSNEGGKGTRSCELFVIAFCLVLTQVERSLVFARSESGQAIRSGHEITLPVSQASSHTLTFQHGGSA